MDVHAHAASLQTATADRARKLNELKSKLVAACCQGMLNPPLPSIGALRFDKDDTEEEKDEKRRQHARLCQQREAERIRREPELVRELEKIMDRIRLTRREYTKPEVDYGSAAASLDTYLEFRCKQCHNRNPELFAANPHTGDTACMECGYVVEEHHIDMGQVTRSRPPARRRTSRPSFTPYSTPSPHPFPAGEAQF